MALAHCYDSTRRHFDLGVEGGQFVHDDTLRGPVRISVHTDRRVEASELEDGETNQRGWWGDRFRDDDEPIGSRLWLLNTAKPTVQNAEKGRIYMVECLIWMVRRGLAERIEAEAEIIPLEAGADAIRVTGMIYQPGDVAPRFSEVWEQTRAA